MSTVYASIPIAGGDTATPLNLDKRAKLIGRYLAPGSPVIDCGCGEGAYVYELMRRYSVDCVGIEHMPEKVARASLNPAVASRVIQADIEQIPFEDGQFDVAIVNEVLEHVPSEAKALTEIHRVLSTGGKLIVMSPNRWYPFESHGVRWKSTKKPVPRIVPFVPYVPLTLGNRVFEYWARNYWQGELASMVRAAGFQITDRTWIWQTFENISKSQAALIRTARPVLRRIANTCERTLFVRRFGVSQVIVATKVVRRQTNSIRGPK
jgi:ubiquinone/menaquinone biosynthesis C-methylase UbiE